MTRPGFGLQWALVLAPFLLLPGCRGERDAGLESPTGGDVVTTVMDSSGVAIVVNEGTWCPARYRVLAHTERRIPSDEGELAVFTVGIAGARLLGDGRVAVPDGSNQRLEIYGPDGRLASELLRAGSGPVEVAGPFSFRVSAPDTLIVWDTRRLRMFTITLAGEVASEAVLHTSEGGMIPNLHIPPFVTPTPSGGLVYMEPDFIDSPNALQMALRLTVRNPSGVLTQVDEWLGQTTPQNPRFNNPVLAAPVFDFAGDASGHVVYARPDAPWEVRYYDLSGRLRRIVRADVPRTSFDGRLFERAMERVRAQGHAEPQARQMAAAFRSMDHPDSLTAIASLHANEGGGVWVGRNAPLEPTTRLDIFDSEGVWRGCLVVDETLGTLQDVRDHHALFLHTDSLGEQSLRLIQIGEIASPSG